MGNIDRQDLSVSVSISEEMSWHLHAADTFHFSHVGTQRAVRRSCFLPSADNCPATGNCPATQLFVLRLLIVGSTLQLKTNKDSELQDRKCSMVLEPADSLDERAESVTNQQGRNP